MAFTVEDGTGIAGANALVSVSEFNTFASDRNVDVSGYSTGQIEAAIIVASVDYIDTFFTFKGDALTTTQGMQIPTDCVGVESNIKRACYQAAMLSLQGRLFVDPTELEVGGQIISERDKLDVLETGKEYAEGLSYTFKYPTNSIDRLVTPYTVSGGGMGSTRLW